MSVVNKSIKKVEEKLKPEDFNKASLMEKQYKSMGPLKGDKRFGDVTILKNETNNSKVFVKEKVSSNEAEATKDINSLKKRMDISHPNIQKLHDYSTSVKKEWCSTFYLSKGFYELPENDLAKEIAKRKKINTPFTHKELTHMAFQLTHGLNYLQSRNLSHGDIRPSFVGINDSKGEYKLLDRLENPEPVQNLYKNYLMRGNSDLYLSPELLKQIQSKNKTEVPVDKHKNDSWALGMTLLEAANLESVQNVYSNPENPKVKEFNAENLENNLRKMEDRYGNENPLFCGIVRKYLEVDEAERPCFNKMESEMPKYEDVIEELENENLNDDNNNYEFNNEEEHVVVNSGFNKPTNNAVNSKYVNSNNDLVNNYNYQNNYNPNPSNTYNSSNEKVFTSGYYIINEKGEKVPYSREYVSNMVSGGNLTTYNSKPVTNYYETKPVTYTSNYYETRPVENVNVEVKEEVKYTPTNYTSNEVVTEYYTYDENGNKVPYKRELNNPVRVSTVNYSNNSNNLTASNYNNGQVRTTIRTSYRKMDELNINNNINTAETPVTNSNVQKTVYYRIDDEGNRVEMTESEMNSYLNRY